MTLNNEELISRYFDHSMSPAEEQNFLIKLAASDELRIAFRSQLELMKAIRHDKDDMRSAATVRNRTFAVLGLSAAAVGTYVEQGLLHSNTSSAPVRQQAATPMQQPTLQASYAAKPSVLSRVFRSRFLAAGSGLLLGFTSAVFMLNSHSQQEITPNSNIPQISRTVEPSMSTPNSLNHAKTANKAVNEQQNLDKLAISVPKGVSPILASHPKTETINKDKSLDNGSAHSANSVSNTQHPVDDQPAVISKSKPNTMTVEPPTINTLSDSSKVQ